MMTSKVYLLYAPGHYEELEFPTLGEALTWINNHPKYRLKNE